jgi:hypothetical protein
MGSFTVAPELRGTKGDILAARIEVPILLVMIYGIFEFIRLGWSPDHYFFTYGSGRRRCLSRSFHLLFSCIGASQEELENSFGSARISSIYLFAIRHRSSWPVRDI